MFKRRALMTSALASLLLTSAAGAADFPSKTIRIVVPYAAACASGIGDQSAKPLAEGARSQRAV